MEETSSTQKILSFLDKNSNLILFAILILALILRLKYLTINQAVWYDEAAYLSAAKNWAFNTAYYQLHYVRPPFLPFMFSIFYKLGAGEIFFRILMIVFSMVGVFFTYLVGKDLFNKSVALIATFLMSVFYLQLFYTARLLTGMPSATFWIISIWLFWNGYVEKKSKVYLWLLGLFMVLGTLTRFPFGLLGIILLIFLLLTERLKFLNSKQLWTGVAIAIVSFIPYTLWYIKTYSKVPILGAASFYQSANHFNTYLDLIPRVLQSPIPGLTPLFPTAGQFLVLLFLIGIVFIIFNLIVGYNLLTKTEKLKKYLLTFLWIAIPFFYFAFLAGQVPEDRYLFYIYPAIFYLVGFVLILIYNKTKRYNAIISSIIILLILLSVSFTQVKYADNLIESKSLSYVQFNQAGNWIKENSAPNEKIIASGIPQLSYYAEREILSWPLEEEFNELIQEEDVKFMVLSVLEGSPQWSYGWPEVNKDKVIPIQVYPDAQNRPIVVIYEIIK
tara:strand:- start:2288 stop:3790 length:1503 start_codon:yes stop_codon:yes gene_type:complete